MTDEDLCCQDDLRIELTVSVSVDSNSEPELDWAPQLGPTGDEPYWCMNCFEKFKSWERALDHLKEANAEVAA